MIKVTAWVHQNCRFAESFVSVPKSTTGKGTMGFSRIYELAFFHLETSCGLKNIFKDAHVATFGLDKDAAPENQIRLSWAGFDDPASPAIKLRIVEQDIGSKWMTWEDLGYDGCGKTKEACVRTGDFFIRTDKYHTTAGHEFTGTCQDALLALKKRAKYQLDPRARWSMAVRFLPSP